MKKYILSFSCDDRPGLVAAVTALLAKLGGNILESQQYNDLDQHRFFMRVGFECATEISILRDNFSVLATAMNMIWRIRDSAVKQKVILLVSKLDHCLSDLLYRLRIGELNMNVVGIISNHPEAALNLAFIEGIPYHYLPISKANKPQQEAQIKAVIAQSGAELVVLARYMQILSDDLTRTLSGRCINIHHSFLPGFKGAKPYHQAHARGVKMIGATAHFVTTELDEGPIIHQDVEAIGHADSPDDLVRKGRDIERRVLAAALHWYLDDRVFINGSKTVVFRD